MKTSIRLQLSAMMFLEYLIWGAWFVAMGIYLPAVLKADGAQVGLAYGNAWFGAIVLPFFIGLIADRYFSAQKVLGVLHLIGPALHWQLSKMQDIGAFSWVSTIGDSSNSHQRMCTPGRVSSHACTGNTMHSGRDPAVTPLLQAS